MTRFPQKWRDGAGSRRIRIRVLSLPPLPNGDAYTWVPEVP
jgi:hypothetical protein